MRLPPPAKFKVSDRVADRTTYALGEVIAVESSNRFLVRWDGRPLKEVFPRSGAQLVAAPESRPKKLAPEKSKPVPTPPVTPARSSRSSPRTASSKPTRVLAALDRAFAKGDLVFVDGRPELGTGVVVEPADTTGFVLVHFSGDARRSGSPPYVGHRAFNALDLRRVPPPVAPKRPRLTAALLSARRAYLQALAEHRAWRSAVETVRLPEATSHLTEALSAAAADARLALDRATFRLIDATSAAGLRPKKVDP